MKKTLIMLFVLFVFLAICFGHLKDEFTCPCSDTPNYRSDFIKGHMVRIKWNSFNHPVATKVRLVLYKGGMDEGHKIGNIAQNIPIGAGDYYWKVGTIEGGAVWGGNII